MHRSYNASHVNSRRSPPVAAFRQFRHCCELTRVMNRGFFEEIGEGNPVLKAKILNEIAFQLCDRLRQANIEISALRN